MRIAATIVVERDAHKGMVIGDGGERLKRIGTEARQELEQLLDAKVFLELWVKVRSGWADDEAAPAQLRLRMNAMAAGAAAPAFVLHSYDWSESSLILELFTRERAASSSRPRAPSGRPRSCAPCCCRSSASGSACAFARR